MHSQSGIVVSWRIGMCRFQALLQDAFPGVSIPEATDDQMVAAIHGAAASLQLQVVPEQASFLNHAYCSSMDNAMPCHPPSTASHSQTAVSLHPVLLKLSHHSNIKCPTIKQM